ncbi:MULTISPECIES: hypothetical protein [Vagococcus]|uniref:Uncharacterized protein n=1 Tax=Vagococcus fluvialis bH819 TaxID=1255619 RepID=A0A1X6WTZ6_9ENTE|nr:MULTISPECIES: hypothetical protein [Vagococcus]SLM87096.1 hypothetical protein FM121_13440 [Vagococcus fluvialis bH819]HCM90555.1 hypothetical protein [Vagococcus sp.]
MDKKKDKVKRLEPNERVKKLDDRPKVNPFSIGASANKEKTATTSNIGQTMLESKVQVKETGDKRKAVRMPTELYDDLMSSRNDWGAKGSLLTGVLDGFYTAFQREGEKLLTTNSHGETRPVKVSTADFKLLKLIKFETDMSYTDIIASAILYHNKVTKKSKK